MKVVLSSLYIPLGKAADLIRLLGTKPVRLNELEQV